MLTPALLDRFEGVRILIVGDVMLDEYVWGVVRRVSPEAPVPVVEARRRTYATGGASNVATNVVSLGGTATLGGVVGQDESGAQLKSLLNDAQVQTSGLLPAPDRPTTTKTRIIAHSQQVVRVDSEERASIPEAVQVALLDWAQTHLPNVEACVLSDYLKGVLSPEFTEKFFALARQCGKPVIVDPKGADYSRYRGATVLKPNIRELEQVTNRDIESDAALRDAAQEVMALLDGSALLVSRGDQGMALFQPNADPIAIAPIIRPVYDTTGAGDTVISTLALALGAGLAMETAARLANHAAGIVVGKLGTACVTLDELRQDLVVHESE